MSDKSATQRLLDVQAEIVAPKNQLNKFGGYKYRSQEDILQAVKPLLAKNQLFMTITDSVEFIGERYYIKATVSIFDAKNGAVIAANSALARESESKKGMDDSQISGTASSYARKYALNGILLIDDTKDADSNEYPKEQKKPQNAMPEAMLRMLEKYDEESLRKTVNLNQKEYLNSMSDKDKLAAKQAGYTNFTIVGLAYELCEHDWPKALKLLEVYK